MGGEVSVVALRVRNRYGETELLSSRSIARRRSSLEAHPPASTPTL